MLMKSDINPFDSQETKPYKNDPRISAMTDLVDSYQRDDIQRYEAILQNNKDVMADPFIAENISEVTQNMRTKAVLKLIAPYTRFTLAFLAKQLKISVSEVQDIVGFLIIDKKLKAKIDQEQGAVEIDNNSDAERLQAMQAWTSAIGSLTKVILNESEGFKSDESSQNLGGLQSTHMEHVEAMHDSATNGTMKMKGGKKGFSGGRQPMYVK